ncbi:MAG: HU family DNA-binding protein [Candidatus Tectomicrobia bacterium]|nr:HU family DNA-binding protein [Candidatus Tectomicrobia bacterium]
MTKAEFIDQVADSGGLTKKDTEAVLEAVFATMSKAVREETRFSYPGFGTFTIRERAARSGRNPRTGETIAVKATRTVGFKAAPALKATL